MRTTINIDEQLLETARIRARSLGITLGKYVERAIQGESSRVAPVERAHLPIFHGTGVQPGVDLRSNRVIQELLDEGLPLDKLR